jgi:transposase InsO family protein
MLANQILKESNGQYAKSKVAAALGFSRGLYYHKSKLSVKDKKLANELESYYKIDDTLGHRKLGVLLCTGKNRVKRVMKKYGIEARKPSKKYVYPGKTDVIHPNLANEPNIKLLFDLIFSDIFELQLSDGSRVRGCFALLKKTRQILSLVFDYGMAADLVVAAIRHIDFMDADIIFHSDQGKQFGAKKTLDELMKKGFFSSMSRAGTPTDNAFAERFVGIFKHAVASRYRYDTLGEFLKAAETWINFYNNKRPHESLGQLSPNDFAKHIGYNIVSYIPMF